MGQVYTCPSCAKKIEDGQDWSLVRKMRGLSDSVAGWRTAWSSAQPAGEISRMKRNESAMSAVVASVRSRGRALRRHQEELLREGDAGADANV